MQEKNEIHTLKFFFLISFGIDLSSVIFGRFFFPSKHWIMKNFQHTHVSWKRGPAASLISASR